MMSLIFFVGCGGPLPEGWLLSEQTGGPTVNYDVLAEPLPEIPLPNDQATRLDPTSPTGRRLNISEEASTEYERRTRRSFNEKREYAELPGRIEAAEAEQEAVGEALGDPATYQPGGEARLAELTARAEALPGEIEALYARWEELESLDD